MPIETVNRFMVGSSQQGIKILGRIENRIISPDDALLLAAYLVSMAEHMATNKFEDVLEAVQNT